MRDLKTLDFTELCTELVSDPATTDYQYMKTFHRHLWDMENSISDTVRFNVDIAKSYLFIIQLFKHAKGEKAGEHFILEDWQLAAVGIFVGWQVKDSKGRWVRRFKEGLFFIARKNGKSILSAGIALAADIIEGEAQNDICFIATKKAQAMIAWDMYYYLTASLPNEFKGEYRKVMSEVKKKDGGKAFFLGRDSSKEDGLNINCLVLDEYAAAVDSSLKDVCVSSMGSRVQPMILTITTAGHNLGSPLLAELDYGLEVMSEYNSKTDRGFRNFYFIAQPSIDLDPFSDEALRQANPNIEVSVSIDFLREAAKDAKEQVSKRVEYLVKHVNLFQNAAEVFITSEAIKKSIMPIEQFDNIDKSGASRLILGLDMSITGDFTSFVKLWVFNNGIHLNPDGTDKVFVEGMNYLPREIDWNERGRQLRVPLTQWKEQDFIRETQGKVINFEFMYQEILTTIHEAQAKGIEVYLAYDPYSSQQIISRLEQDEGFTDVFKVNQGFSLSESLVAIRNKFMHGEIILKANACNVWQLSNVEIMYDAYSRIRFTKENPVKKIDFFAATACAFKQYLWLQESEPSSTPVYFG